MINVALNDALMIKVVYVKCIYTLDVVHVKRFFCDGIETLELILI